MLISKSPSLSRPYLLSFREIQQTLYRIFNIDVSQMPQTQHAGNRKLHLSFPAVFQYYLPREMASPPVTCFILDSFLFFTFSTFNQIPRYLTYLLIFCTLFLFLPSFLYRLPIISFPDYCNSLLSISSGFLVLFQSLLPNLEGFFTMHI